MKNESTPLIQMANPDKVARLKVSYEEFKEFAKDKNISVSYNMNQKDVFPLNTIGSVTLRAKKMSFNNCKWLSEVSKLANNISVTPYLDGTFDYCLTFIETMVTISENVEVQ